MWNGLSGNVIHDVFKKGSGDTGIKHDKDVRRASMK